MRGIDGPVRADVDVLVEPVAGSRSRLTISVDFTGHGIGKILVPLMVRREAEKEMPVNMAALKQRMEAGWAAKARRGMPALEGWHAVGDVRRWTGQGTMVLHRVAGLAWWSLT